MESFLSTQMRALFWQLKKEIEDSLTTYNVFKKAIQLKLDYHNVEKLLKILVKVKRKNCFLIKGNTFEKIEVPFVSEQDSLLVKVREVWEQKVDDAFSIKRYQRSLKENIEKILNQKAELIKMFLTADCVVVYIFEKKEVDDSGRNYNLYQQVILS